MPPADLGCPALGAHTQRAERRGDHLPYGEGLKRLTAGVVEQRGFQCRQAQFVGAQRARQRVLAQASHERLVPNQDSGLRAAQQFIARKHHQRRARRQRFLNHGLVAQSEGCRIEQRARAQVVHYRHLMRRRNSRHLSQSRLTCEPDQAEVRMVGTQHHCGARAEGFFEVGRVRAIARADLDQARARLAHDIRDTESPADLDQLRAGNDHLAPLGEGGEREQYCAGVVIDDQCSFGAGDAGEQPFGVCRARASLAGGQVVFESGVALGHLLHGAQGGGAERRAAEVGVQDDAGGIDHRHQAGRGPLGQVPLCAFEEHLGRWNGLPGAHSIPRAL